MGHSTWATLRRPSPTSAGTWWIHRDDNQLDWLKNGRAPLVRRPPAVWSAKVTSRILDHCLDEWNTPRVCLRQPHIPSAASQRGPRGEEIPVGARRADERDARRKPAPRADAGRQRDDREARPVPVVRERDLGDVGERLVVAVPRAAARRSARSARRARRSRARRTSRASAPRRRSGAPGATTYSSRGERAVLAVLEEAADGRPVLVAAIVEAAVPDEHLGADDVEEGEPEVEVDVRRRDARPTSSAAARRASKPSATSGSSSTMPTRRHRDAPQRPTLARRLDARHRREQRLAVGDAPRHRPGMVERRRERHDAADRHEPARRLDRRRAAHGRRDAQRPRRVRARRGRRHPRGERGRRAAARPARRAVERPADCRPGRSSHPRRTRACAGGRAAPSPPRRASTRRRIDRSGVSSSSALDAVSGLPATA